MSSRKKGKGAPSTSSSSPPPPPSRRTNGPGGGGGGYGGGISGGYGYGGGGGGGGGGGNQQRNRRRRSYADDKGRGNGGNSGNEMSIILCVYQGAATGWRTQALTFRPGRMSDGELWNEIRRVYRDELEMLWRRLFLFKKTVNIVPIEFTRNDVPKRKDPKDIPGSHEFMHAYRHPARLRTHHDWVDWFVEFKQKAGQDQSVGLEFIEGIWADKLAALAILLTFAIIAISIVWWQMGTGLQTVFTVMGFVLSLVAAYVALMALYYQVTLPG